MELAPADGSHPTPWFDYRGPGEGPAASARPAAGPIAVDFTGSPTVTHVWDEGRGGWLRSQDGTPHTTADGDQLAPENVVIMITDYTTSPADPISPEVRSTGSGPLVVLTDGMVVSGRWERASAADQPTLTDGDGRPIRLAPGRTWVQMPERGQTSFDPAQELADPAWEAVD